MKSSVYDEAKAYINKNNMNISVEQLEKDLEKYAGFSMSEFEDRINRTMEKKENLSDEERVSIDTYGAECLFLKFFVSEKMSEDFPLIARDFLEHEFLNLGQYCEPKYLDIRGDVGSPLKVYQNMVLNLMYNAYKKGIEFAKAQFQYLYKTYYKKEYNQIKRFRVITYDDLLYISYGEDNKKSRVSDAWVCWARILTIEKMFDNICMDKEDSLFFYIFLDDWNKSLNEKKTDNKLLYDEKVFHDALEIIWKNYEENNKFFDQRELQNLALMNYSNYVDISPTFIFDCEIDLKDSHNLIETYVNALALYMAVTEKKEFTADEIHLIATTYREANAMFNNSYELYDCLADILEDPTPKKISQNSIYHADKIKMQEISTTKTEDKEEQYKENKTDEKRDELLLNEISKLREKVHSLESNEKFYLDTIASKEKTINANENLLKKYQEEHDELVTLRDYVYRFTEEDTSVSTVSFDEMKESIQKQRIVIIGGHDNWISKMKQEFPDWHFISPSASGVVDKGIVKNADKVYFFTDALSHKNYYRYMNLIRENKVPFGYIHSVNINMNVEQLYNELSKK